jgi:hypothetical protein
MQVRKTSPLAVGKLPTSHTGKLLLHEDEITSVEGLLTTPSR